MRRFLGRREFLGVGASALAASHAMAGEALTKGATPGAGATGKVAVKLGIIGCGGRGRGLLGTLLELGGVEVPAVCDVEPAHAKLAQDAVAGAGGTRPEAYDRGADDYLRLLERDDLQAVIIATPWNWHTPMAVASMRAGKYTAVEVPAALTFDECWALVDTSEKTGIPCMMLENWSFRRDNLAVLQMIREGLLGEIVHCHCAHSHDCIDHWFFDGEGNMRWGGEFLVRRNADQYPTHSLGPVLSWMDINCGDAFAHATSTATRSSAINQYFARRFGPDHPNARRVYAQGDIVTTVVRTHGGKTLVVNYDMQLPRPYDNRWMIQGSLGLYDEARKSVYLEGKSPKNHEWEAFEPYQTKHEHPWWKELLESKQGAGHEGTDALELSLFVEAVRRKGPTPIDVYDSATMSCLIPLSERSISLGSAPVECPDFTRGKWKTRKPSFGVVGIAGT